MMKPTKQKQVHRSVDRKKEQSSGNFETLLQGANQERVHSKMLHKEKRPPKEMKKWEDKQSAQKVQQSGDDTLIEDIVGLDSSDYEILRKSLMSPGAPVLSEEQKQLFKRLSDQPCTYDLGASIIEEELNGPVGNISKVVRDVEETIAEDLTEPVEVKQQDKKRKSVVAQRVVPVKPPTPQTVEKTRPISALQNGQHNHNQSQNVAPPTQQKLPPAPSTKKINTNPFANRPKSVFTADPKESLMENKSNPTPQQTNENTSAVSNTAQPQSIQPLNNQLQSLLQRIQKMDDNQREQLERLLDQMESSVRTQNQSSQKKPTQLQLPQQPTIPLISDTKSSKSSFAMNSGYQLNFDEMQGGNIITLVLLSSWGSSNMIGLTEIQAFDLQSKQIKILPQQIIIRNAQSLKPAQVLINDQYQTNNAQNMWLSSLPPPPLKIEIDLQFETQVGALKIYNYNKSLIDSGKGVKEVLVKVNFTDFTTEFNCEIKKSNGNDMTDYGTLIKIKNDFELVTPRSVIQTHSMVSEERDKLLSRKSRGPMVYNIFGEDDSLVRVPTAKTNKSKLVEEDTQLQRNQQQLHLQQQQPQEQHENRRQRNVQQPQVKEDLLKTLKYFDISHPDRFQDNASKVQSMIKPDIPKQPGQPDALDMFFIDQRKPQQETPIVQPQQLPTQQQTSQRVKQTEVNAQQIQQMMSEDKKKMEQFKVSKQKTLTIPTVPVGRNVEIKILSTWGDRHYVGLVGIEFFDDKGKTIEIIHPKRQVKADPADINTLPEYDNDPRTADKLVDGSYYTQSDLNVWLAPFQKETGNFIYVDLLERRAISMIRIWNYNKSRIHSFRGVKELQISLDNKPVFQGIISKAPGNLSWKEATNERLFELILFTGDQKVLKTIADNDWINQDYNENIPLADSIIRPPTGVEQRPATNAKISQLQSEIKQARQNQLYEQQIHLSELPLAKPKLVFKDVGDCKIMQISYDDNPL